MIIEIKAPSPGESVPERELASWLVEDGDYVEKDQEIAEIESDKATLPLVAGGAGRISLKAATGDIVKVGTVLCTIDAQAKPPPAQSATSRAATGSRGSGKPGQATPPVTSDTTGSPRAQEAIPARATPPAPPDRTGRIKTTPLARKLMKENGLSVDDIISGLRRIGSSEVRAVIDSTGKPGQKQTPSAPADTGRTEKRARISQLRRKLSERLVAVKNETAMLTTFNEADMSEIIRLRTTCQKAFTEKHGVRLGFMSFFTRAATEALKAFPRVNARLEGDELVEPSYIDIGIAIQTEKGLMVPVLRNTERLGLADIEKEIIDLAGKARKNRISMQEMTGGTFTITNGGVFGSMLSTPILNPPQAAILGMHNITERPVARNGQVVIRPMMYLALSYDHRIIDGRESVSFLVKLKEYIEYPLSMLFEGSDPEKLLLELL